MATDKKESKPEYDRLSVPVQTLLKKHEYKILASIQRSSSFSTIAAYVRSLILANIEKKRQTELI